MGLIQADVAEECVCIGAFGVVRKRVGCVCAWVLATLVRLVTV